MLYSRKFFSMLVGALTLTACGFEPLYVEKTSGSDLWYYNNKFDTDIVHEMAKIKVETVTDRIGQMIKNELISSFNPSGDAQNTKYFLKIQPVAKVITQQALRDDITATREKVKYSVNYSLWGVDEGQLVSGNSWIYLSYDLLDNPYSTTMDKKKVENDGAKIIANDISLRIAAYFHSKKTNRGNPDEF